MAVTLGMNGKMDATEAAKVLDWAYTTVVNLCHRRVFTTAQRVTDGSRKKKWMIDATEVYRFKANPPIQKRKKRGDVRHIVVPASLQAQREEDSAFATVVLRIPRDKYKLIEMVFEDADGSIQNYLLQKLDGLHSQIKERLKSVEL